MVIMKSEPVCKAITFTSGDFRLQGYLHLPPLNRPPVVVGVHGLFSSGDSPRQLAMAAACLRHGIAYLRFDHRGCGSSQGNFWEETSLSNRHTDLINAVRKLEGLPEIGDRIGLFGSSFGGTVCISAASARRFDALVSYAAPIRSRSLIKHLDQHSFSETEAGFIRRNLLFDISPQASKIHHVLVVHGDADETVPVSHARDIFRLAGDPKKLWIQSGGDHSMNLPAHQQQFLEDALDWFEKGLRLSS